MFEIDARNLRREANLLPDGTGDRRKIAGAFRHRVNHQRRETDIVAADRQQHGVDRPFAILRSAPGFAHRAVGDLRTAAGIDGQIVAGGDTAASAAHQIGELVELRTHGGVDGAFTRLLVEEQSFGNFRTGTGKAHQGDGAMRIFQRQLQADAERIAILRAVAIGAEPARPGPVEGRRKFRRAQAIGQSLALVLQQPARQHLRIVPR